MIMSAQLSAYADWTRTLVAEPRMPLVTTFSTASRRAFGGADQSNTEAIASGPNGINLRKPDGGNATANADSEIQKGSLTVLG